MTGSNGDWDENRKLVLTKLSELGQSVDKMDEKMSERHKDLYARLDEVKVTVTEVKTSVAMLKTKVATIAALVTGTLFLAAEFLSAWFG